ncbi:phage tail protein [Rhodospirillum sp. A1_3_36]|uniref:phage tail protein n=1 Tax=Rhodospirillum sp. A1_3_36 TaxID=3391666 RepID=UPI0039A4934E
MSMPYIGEVRLLPYPRLAPRGWFPCNGGLISIAAHVELFSVIGTTYGGDGRITFGLPNLTGNVSVLGAGPNDPLGQMSGTPSVTVSKDHLPPHNHSAHGVMASGPNTVAEPENNRLSRYISTEVLNVYSQSGSSDCTMAPETLLPYGYWGEGALENRQPSLALNFFIAYEGAYPASG